MEQDKLIEKTNLLIRKQNEVNDTLQELRKEILNAREMNKNLAIENMELRNKIRAINSPAPLDIMEEVKEDKPVVAGSTIVSSEVLVKKEEKVETQKESRVAYEKPLPAYSEGQKVYKDTSIHRANVYEFFLGKNVIAKFAAILISLGIYTFGRHAYIEWLGDTSRFFLILVMGIIFFSVGYIFELRKTSVFATAFYSIGLTTILISMFVGLFVLEVLSPVVFMIMNTMMIGAVFVYFRNKREHFMDIVLVGVYVAIGYFSLMGISQFDTSVFMGIMLSLNIVLISAVMYLYIKVFYKNDSLFSLILYFVYTISGTVIALFFIFENESIITIWMISIIAITYLGNIKLYDQIKRLNSLLGIQTLLSIIINVFLIYMINDKFFGPYEYIAFLGMFITMIPLYVFLYKDEVDERAHTIDVYGVALVLFLLIYIFSFRNSGYNELNEIVIRNTMFLVSAIIFAVVAKFSKRVTHYALFVWISVSLLLSAMFSVVEVGEISFDLVAIFLPNLLVFLFMVIGNYYYNNLTNNKNHKLTYAINVLSLITFVMGMLMISESLRESTTYRYDFFYITSIIYFIILFKHIFITDRFIEDAKKIYRNVINIGLIFILIIVDFMYFDHNFSSSLDVLIFLMVLLPNIYIVYSLKELFVYTVNNTDYDQEWIFIVLFKLGVFIQSMFIHRYINFTYDKVILSSFFMIAAAVGVLYGFRSRWKKVRYIGLAAIYFSFVKFFVYDFFKQDLSDPVKIVTYISLGVVLMGISFLYSHLEKKYGGEEVLL